MAVFLWIFVGFEMPMQHSTAAVACHACSESRLIEFNKIPENFYKGRKSETT